MQWARVAGFGALCGARSMVGLALLSHAAKGMHTSDAGVRLLARRNTRVTLEAMALGEMVFDKLPAAPARTEPAALAGRVTAGATAGATLAANERLSPWMGAAIGGAAAVGGAWATFALRGALAGRLPGWLAGALEDAAVIAAGRALLSARV